MAAAFPGSGQSGRLEQSGIDSGAGGLLHQPVPLGRSVTQAETADALLVDVALVEIFQGLASRRLKQQPVVLLDGPAKHVVQLLPGVFRPGPRTAAERHPGLLGQLGQGLGKGEAFHPHQKTEHVPTDVAHPAPERLPLGIDLQAGPGVVVPGTQPDQQLALAAQRDVAAHQIGNINRLADLLFDFKIGPGCHRMSPCKKKHHQNRPCPGPGSHVARDDASPPFLRG